MRDVYQRFINPTVSDRQVVVYTRIAVVAIGGVGYVAGTFFPTILSMALWAYTMYGAGITPALLGALLWKRATPYGGVASIAVGMTTTLCWEVIALARSTDGNPDYLFGWQTIFPALVLSVLTLVLVSLVTTPLNSAKRGLSASN